MPTSIPNGQLSRAMLATLFHRLSGGELAGSANPFTDIPVDAWYARAVNWAAANGILLGTSDTTFSPGQVATPGDGGYGALPLRQS